MGLLRLGALQLAVLPAPILLLAQGIVGLPKPLDFI